MKLFCVWLPLCLVVISNGDAQIANGPSFTADSTNQLFVRVSLQGNNDRWHAPADIHMFASVRSLASGQKGDSMRVDFFAGTNYLGTGRAVWHEEIRPDPHSKKAQPMVIVTAGYFPAGFVWTNAPLGNYELTAHAVGTGIIAISEPVNLAVVP